jgi:hypothetical protein
MHKQQTTDPLLLAQKNTGDAAPQNEGDSRKTYSETVD